MTRIVDSLVMAASLDGFAACWVVTRMREPWLAVLIVGVILAIVGLVGLLLGGDQDAT
jgi:hypothetical protein